MNAWAAVALRLCMAAEVFLRCFRCGVEAWGPVECLGSVALASEGATARVPAVVPALLLAVAASPPSAPERQALLSLLVSFAKAVGSMQAREPQLPGCVYASRLAVSALHLAASQHGAADAAGSSSLVP